MKILIIDDEPAIRNVLRMWCEREGYTVYDAPDGKQGVLVQQQHKADLIICDLIMPVQEGIETITYFRKTYPKVGIIAISGGGRIGPHSYLDVAQQLGAWKIFSKPFDIELLLEALKEWKNKKNL